MERLSAVLLGFLYAALLWIFIGGKADPLFIALLNLSIPLIHELLHIAIARLLGVGLQLVFDRGFVGFRLHRVRSSAAYMAILISPQLLTVCTVVLWVYMGRVELLIAALTNLAISCRDIAILGRLLYPSLRAMSLSTSAASSS